jgi:hypothetical protein
MDDANCGGSHEIPDVNRHRNLKVWQRARELVVLAYKLTDGLPERERFIAVPQFLRAA